MILIHILIRYFHTNILIEITLILSIFHLLFESLHPARDNECREHQHHQYQHSNRYNIHCRYINLALLIKHLIGCT